MPHLRLQSRLPIPSSWFRCTARYRKCVAKLECLKLTSTNFYCASDGGGRWIRCYLCQFARLDIRDTWREDKAEKLNILTRSLDAEEVSLIRRDISLSRGPSRDLSLCECEIAHIPENHITVYCIPAMPLCECDPPTTVIERRDEEITRDVGIRFIDAERSKEWIYPVSLVVLPLIDEPELLDLKLEIWVCRGHHDLPCQ
jgi:hypothetical protein